MTAARQHDRRLVAGQLAHTTDSMTPEELESLYRNHAAEIYRFIKRYTAHDDLAQDFTHDVFFKAIRYLSEKRRHIKNPRAWLFSIARNHCITTGKKRILEEQSLGELERRQRQSSYEAADAARMEFEEILRFVTANYAEDEAAMFYLYVLHDFSQAEIAVATGSSQSAVSRVLLSVSARLEQQFRSEKSWVKPQPRESYGA
jgi:RNA polymerase sigma-70 factor (ECF subfamily)